MAAANYATEIAPKPSAAIREQTPPEPWFEHTSPAVPGGAPVYPGALNAIERGEVDRWLSAIDGQRDEILSHMTTRAAILKVTEFETYYASAPYQAWLTEDKLERIQQWRNEVAAAVTGSTADTPDTCEDAEYNIDSGTIGVTTIVVSLTCATGGAAIHYRLNSGSWQTYITPVSVILGATIYFYATADGLADSGTGSLENN